MCLGVILRLSEDGEPSLGSSQKGEYVFSEVTLGRNRTKYRAAPKIIGQCLMISSVGFNRSS
jgi:hypothetical protein